jgi:hypothetical protein
MAEKN